MKRFVRYYRPYKKVLFLDLLAAAAVAACNLLLPLFTRAMLNRYIPERNLRWVLILAGGLLLLYFGKVALNYFMAGEGHIMSARMQADMRQDLFCHLERLPLSYFDNHKTGELMSRMTGDLFDVSELAHHGPEDIFISMIQFIGAFVILMTVSPALTLISFAVIPPMIFFVSRLRRRMKAASRQSRREIAELNAALENSISGIRVTRAFHADEREKEKFADSNRAYVRSRSVFCHAMGVFHGWMGFGTDVLSLLVLTVGGILIIGTGKINYVDLVTFMLYIAVFIQPITKMIGFTEQYENGMTGFARFCEVMEEPTEEDTPGAVEAPPLRGEITFSDVHFAYGGTDEVLRGVSFTVPAGSTVALVGSSGGGKTTVCHLIPRFYEIGEGAVMIDGTDIRQYTRASLRAQIGMVAQDVFLFNATIYDNIAYGTPGATREAVEEAARRARLDEYIRTLPDGYMTVVGERGVKLSGGQKQRVAIARVFLKNPPILILDEATSALDNITEQQIQESLSHLCHGRTTLVVAHRLSTVRDADEIIYIEGGRILERGTHSDLLALSGEYARLVAVTQTLPPVYPAATDA